MFRTIKFLLSVVFICFLVPVIAPANPVYAASHSPECSYLNAAGATNVGANYTNGRFGAYAPGDYIVVTVTLRTASAVSFRIVADDMGTITLAGPRSGAGTLIYEVKGPLPGPGIGYFIDSANGTVDVSITCGDVPPAIYVPAGFVQKRIICDVAVYSEPDLSRPTADRLRNGQVWYVNPKPLIGKDGKSWSEVFVAGPVNGYIPTSCIR